MAGNAVAEPANNGIWLQSVNSGNQAWAYYPYDPSHPFTGGSFSAPNHGTAYFTVMPGSTIYRKYIVLNNEPYNDSVSYQITGLPSDWGLSYTHNNPIVISYVYNPSLGQGAQNSHQGFGEMVVAIPSSAAPGTYTYTIKATSGTGYTSSLTDSIIVGVASPTSTPTPTPTPAPESSSTPTPTITSAPSIDGKPTITPEPASSSTPTTIATDNIIPDGKASITATTQKPVTYTGIIIGATLNAQNATQTGKSTPATPAVPLQNETSLLLVGITAIVLLALAGYIFLIRK